MKLAIFDFDGTLFEAQTIPFFMHHYSKQDYPKGPYLNYQLKVLGKIIKYKNPFIKGYEKEQFRRDAALLFIQVFNGMDKALLDKFLEEVAEQVIQHLSIPVVEEVKACKEKGHYCILLSGCYTPILEKIAASIGIDAVIGSPIEEKHIREGKVAVDVLDVVTGKRKVQKLLKLLQGKKVNWQDSIAYGDSIYDRSILELVGNPVAVRPDAGLEKLAIEEKWRIIN